MTKKNPGFPIGGGHKPSRGAPTYDLPNFVKNCLKLRKFGAIEGSPKSATELPLIYLFVGHIKTKAFLKSMCL